MNRCWPTTASAPWLLLSAPNPRSSSSQPPWPLLSAPNESRCFPWPLLPTPNDSRCFYAFVDDNNRMAKCVTINLPNISGLICIGSSQGFLITIDSYGKITAINPLTGACFPLPPTAPHPDVLAYRQRCHPSPIDHTSKVRVPRQKAVISPSLDKIAVVTYGFYEDWWTYITFLSIAFATAGDDSWTYLRLPISQGIHDIIFHQGRLFVTHFHGFLVYDVENPTAPPLVLPNLSLEQLSPSFLTETPDGEDLLLLWRREGSRLSAYYKTKEMVVFKLDKNELKWNRLQSIGDVALFFGGVYLSSLSTREFPCFKSNHIYFTARYIPYPRQNIEDMGVYDLKDGSIQPLTSPADLGQVHWPPPIWFTPRL